MVLKESRYKGCTIYTNVNEEFGTVYHTIYNSYTDSHVHINGVNSAKRVVDCLRSNNKTRFGRVIRNKALVLEGFNVLYK